MSNPASVTILIEISGLIKQNPDTLNVFCFLNLSKPRSEMMLATEMKREVYWLINGFRLTRDWKRVCMSTWTKTSNE